MDLSQWLKKLVTMTSGYKTRRNYIIILKAFNFCDVVFIKHIF